MSRNRPRPPLTPAKRRASQSRHVRARHNVEALVDGFGEYVERFEKRQAFPGPSLYFHERAIARRRVHASIDDLLADTRFFEYIYAVLPAWGMHRMGPQAAKVGDFDVMVESFRQQADAIAAIDDLRITEIPAADRDDLAHQLWDIIASLKVSTSRTRIVAGSKALHHVLPDLVPPIDRQYTFRFFVGQTQVHFGDERAFLEWFPLLCEVGDRARSDIDDAMQRRGFMATSISKVIDNAIMGFSGGTS